MNNKILITTLFFIIFLINVVVAIEPYVADIKLVNQDPIPAIPGEYVDVVFEISGLNSNDGFAVKLLPEYPFSLDPGASPIQTLATNLPYSKDFKQAWNVHYKLRVADDAVKGDYKLKLLSHLGNSVNFGSGTLVSHYQNEFPITINDLQTDFATVIQESSGTQVSLGIVNTGENVANALIVGIPQQDSFRVTGTSEQIVGNLAAGDYTIVNFNIAPRFNVGQITKGELQKLKVKLDYTDGIGKRRSVTKEISLDSSQLQGNFTAGFGPGMRNNINQGTSTWWYVIAIVAVIGIVFFGYKKYGNRIKKLIQKGEFGKEISDTPDWVLAEKTRKK